MGGAYQYRNIFAQFKTMRRKQNLARKVGVTMHFLDIIKLQFGRKRHTLLCILLLFRIIVPYLSLKMRGYPQFSFWISVAPAKICFFRAVLNDQ